MSKADEPPVISPALARALARALKMTNKQAKRMVELSWQIHILCVNEKSIVVLEALITVMIHVILDSALAGKKENVLHMVDAVADKMRAHIRGNVDETDKLQ